MATRSLAEVFIRPAFVSAPMVEQSCVAFRHLVRQHGVTLAYTPMINAKVFATSKTYRKEMMDWLDSANDSPLSADSPVVAQLAGDDPIALVNAGKYLQSSVAAIDLNLGCPQGIARKGHYGAYLLPEKELVQRILSTMVDKIDCPITAKIRKLRGATNEDIVTYCQKLENCGIQLLTVHGRTVDSSKQYTSEVDWEIIKLIKSMLKIPIVANGGISNLDDVHRCLQETGVDGVMSSEALLENPKMFSVQGHRNFIENYIPSQLETARELILLFESYGLQEKQNQLTSHLYKILHRMLDCEMNRDLRNQLGKIRIQRMMSFIDELESRYAMYEFKDDEEMINAGQITRSGWYYRHRDEKSLTRMLTPKKSSPASSPYLHTPENVEEKLNLLRQRLNQRKLRESQDI